MSERTRKTTQHWIKSVFLWWEIGRDSESLLVDALRCAPSHCFLFRLVYSTTIFSIFNPPNLRHGENKTVESGSPLGRNKRRLEQFTEKEKGQSCRPGWHWIRFFTSVDFCSRHHFLRLIRCRVSAFDAQNKVRRGTQDRGFSCACGKPLESWRPRFGCWRRRKCRCERCENWVKVISRWHPYPIPHGIFLARMRSRSSSSLSESGLLLLWAMRPFLLSKRVWKSLDTRRQTCSHTEATWLI